MPDLGELLIGGALALVGALGLLHLHIDDRRKRNADPVLREQLTRR